jgi:hypothetical protein
LVVATPVIDKDATGHNILHVRSIAPDLRENSMEGFARPPLDGAMIWWADWLTCWAVSQSMESV